MNLCAPAVQCRTASADILHFDSIINLNLQVSIGGHIPWKKYCKYMVFHCRVHVLHTWCAVGRILLGRRVDFKLCLFLGWCIGGQPSEGYLCHWWKTSRQALINVTDIVHRHKQHVRQTLESNPSYSIHLSLASFHWAPLHDRKNQIIIRFLGLSDYSGDHANSLTWHDLSDNARSIMRNRINALGFLPDTFMHA